MQQATPVSTTPHFVPRNRNTNWWWGPLGVVKHELRRTLTLGRIATWMLMALFPPLLIGITTWQLNTYGTGLNSADTYFGITFLLFVLIPQVVTVLGTVLWATPIVYSELEAQTWVYSVVRPGARRGVLVGKYAVAVLWTLSSAIVATTLCVPISGIDHAFETWGVLCCLDAIAAIAYGALFLMIGTVIQKRAMVSAFMYAFFIEAIISTLPATINQVTVSFRLRAMLFQWLPMKSTSAKELTRLFDTDLSAPWHLLCLCALSAFLITIALWRVQATQFIWQSEV